MYHLLDNIVKLILFFRENKMSFHLNHLVYPAQSVWVGVGGGCILFSCCPFVTVQS